MNTTSCPTIDPFAATNGFRFAADACPDTSATAEPVYHRVSIVQGTTDWQEWRRHGIGASDAATIMGEHPYKSIRRLLLEKLGRVEGPWRNERMDLGLALEPVARKVYARFFGTQMDAVCLQSRQLSWLRASVDGLSANGGHIVEIKCGPSAYSHLCKTGQPLPYYRAQLQHLLAVTELETIDFLCYLPYAEPVCLTIERDDAYIAKLLCCENAFWERVLAES